MERARGRRPGDPRSVGRQPAHGEIQFAVVQVFDQLGLGVLHPFNPRAKHVRQFVDEASLDSSGVADPGWILAVPGAKDAATNALQRTVGVAREITCKDREAENEKGRRFHGRPFLQIAFQTTRAVFWRCQG